MSNDVYFTVEVEKYRERLDSVRVELEPWEKQIIECQGVIGTQSSESNLLKEKVSNVWKSCNSCPEDSSSDLWLPGPGNDFKCRLVNSLCPLQHLASQASYQQACDSIETIKQRLLSKEKELKNLTDALQKNKILVASGREQEQVQKESCAISFIFLLKGDLPFMWSLCIFSMTDLSTRGKSSFNPGTNSSTESQWVAQNYREREKSRTSITGHHASQRI